MMTMIENTALKLSQVLCLQVEKQWHRKSEITYQKAL